MTTFLTNPRMAPELAARIERSIVKGRSGGDAFQRRLVALFRIVVVIGIASAASALLLLRQKEHTELETARHRLLAAVAEQSAGLAAEDARTVDRATTLLTHLSGAFEGDVIAPEVRGKDALRGVLGRPLLYVRGPSPAFRSTAELSRAAAASFKDAFLLCLLEPPSAKTEAAILPKVHAAYAGGSRVNEHTENVHRLRDVAVGVPVLLPDWAERVRAASSETELAPLEREFGKAPLAEAKAGARARLLLFAMDEPGVPGISELDGEHPHDVRVGLVDLAANRTLLRLRRHVDPSFASAEKRASYASGLDGCALALDVLGSAETPP